MSTRKVTKPVVIAMIKPHPARWSFQTYPDIEGNIVGHQIGTDRKTGEPIYKRFKWEANQRLMTLKNPKEIEFILNSPYCQGSELCGKQPFFRVLDAEKDAEEIVKDDEILADALYFATKIVEGDELRDLAVLCGSLSDHEKSQRAALISKAKSNPKAFIELTEGADVATRSLIERARAKKVIILKGSILIWKTENGEEVLGSDYSETISKLMGDDDLFAAIEKRLK